MRPSGGVGPAASADRMYGMIWNMRKITDRVQHFWGRVEMSGDMRKCWRWVGGTRSSDGGKTFYGQFWDGVTTTGAHRYALELFRDIDYPRNRFYSIDHLCRNTLCVNPTHLEFVHHKENVRRGISPAAENARRTHCVRGHALTPDNLYRHGGRWGGRRCKVCHNAEASARRLEKTKTMKWARLPDGTRRWMPR